MKSQNTKSSDQLKKEVDKEIRNVKRDLDEIEGRLSPGQIIDDAIFYPHGKNLRSTMDHLKRNPIGTAFLSLGTLLLMEDESHQTFEASSKVKITQARSSLNQKVGTVASSIKEHLPSKEQISGSASRSGESIKSKVNDLKNTVQSKVSRAKVELENKSSDLQSTISEKKDDLQSTFSEKKDDLQSSFSSESESQFGSDAGAYDGGVTAQSPLDSFEQSGKAQQLKDKASAYFASGKDKVQNLDPMAYMALGAGLGALTGASLPVSDKEANFVDDKFSEKFSSIGQDLQDAINESSNILKDLVIGDVKDMSFNVFK